MGISIEELQKATHLLKVAIQLLKQTSAQQPQNLELERALRDACIQRCEFCVEIAWKSSIRVLGLETKAPNPAVRDMAQNKLIDDPKVWFEFLAARNKTSHTYDEVVAKEVYAEIEKIVPELEKLAGRLQKIK